MTECFYRQYRMKDTGEHFEVKITIDVDSLAKTIAVRAQRNTNGKSQMLGGDIKAVVTKRNTE